MSDDDFFIGWSAETPKVDRRFFLSAGLALLAGTGATAGLIAAHQKAPGRGTWNQGDVRTFRGIITGNPYAMLRTTDLDGTPKTALLSCLGKCGVAARIGALEGQPVTIQGSVIQRGPHVMIAVIDGLDWIAPAPPMETDAALAFPAFNALGDVTLSGEILDTKCWFGAMRPSEGKVHKACAALCIRGGLPPAFLATDRENRRRLLIMTDRDAAHGETLLPLVADPVRMSATVKQRGDLLFLDGPVSAIQRLT
ncbi:MAG: hypothetical protein AAGJ29_04525 [Pseudomonadota bacterium]